ncbi:hypothetical protein CIHG_03484 [Coccidioides immitis H538.4]|nr:hypothetical protein CIRG_08833 [Coccidioides immitis RMSCC 2394]KMU85954.1 hypothetical protein CIHG_03484 [Coccidioides immitis H538.4]
MYGVLVIKQAFGDFQPLRKTQLLTIPTVCYLSFLATANRFCARASTEFTSFIIHRMVNVLSKAFSCPFGNTKTCLHIPIVELDTSIAPYRTPPWKSTDVKIASYFSTRRSGPCRPSRPAPTPNLTRFSGVSRSVNQVTPLLRGRSRISEYHFGARPGSVLRHAALQYPPTWLVSMKLASYSRRGREDFNRMRGAYKHMPKKTYYPAPHAEPNVGVPLTRADRHFT